MKKIYPINISSYFLNYSYGNVKNFENRIFITFPKESELILNDEEQDFISLCFEMNSAFKENNMNKKCIKIMVNSEEKIKCKNLKQFESQLTKNVNHNKTIVFDTEEKMYLNMVLELENFLDNQFLNKWIIFCKENNKEIEVEKESVKFNTFLSNTKEIFKEILNDFFSGEFDLEGVSKKSNELFLINKKMNLYNINKKLELDLNKNNSKESAKKYKI